MSRDQRIRSSDLTWASVAFVGVFVAALSVLGRLEPAAEASPFRQAAVVFEPSILEVQNPIRPMPDQHFGGCDEARSAGRENIPSHDPSYRESMDGDGDGLACEPYR